MENNIQNKFYHIIANSILECTNSKNISVCHEMNLFIHNIAKESPCPIPLDELHRAKHFCEDLDTYRISIDPYFDDNEPISAELAKSIMYDLAYYEPLIEELHTPKAQSDLATLKCCLKTHFDTKEPQTTSQKQHIKIYNDPNFLQLPEEERLSIYENILQSFTPPQKKNVTFTKEQQDYFRHIIKTLKTLAKDTALANATTPNRTEKLLRKALKVANGLPSKIESRTKRFQLKSDLNKLLFNFAITQKKKISPTGDTNSVQSSLHKHYATVAEKAHKEMERWLKAIENANLYKGPFPPNDDWCR